MLTVEGKGRKNRFVLRLRRRAQQRLWSRPFLIALGVSLLLHVVGLTLFRFPQLQLGTLRSHRPVVVDSHLFDASAPAAEAYLGGHPSKPPLPSSTLTPRSPAPDLPHMVPIQPLPFSITTDERAQPFADATTPVKSALTQHRPLPVVLGPPKVSVQLCGRLAECSQLSDVPLPNPKNWHGTAHEPLTIRFTAVARQETGRLFWWELRSDIHPQSASVRAAENVLRETRLHIGEAEPLVHGEVEVTLYPKVWKP